MHKTPRYHTAYDVSKSTFNPEERSNTGKSSFLSSMDDLCEEIFQRAFSQTFDLHGLVVVAGATNTGKSRIARGLIYKFLKTQVAKSVGTTRRPHLVTFEDPIDEYWAEDPDAAKHTGVDYTPREKRKDANSLNEVVDAALRQTPSVFFVGETRDPQDWKEVFRFASTGHMCVTTSHSGSLTEAMGQLLLAMEAKSPAGRSEVAHRIMALVHLRSHKVVVDGKTLKVTLPAIWVRSPVSSMTLMADGLTALLPYREAPIKVTSSGGAKNLGCLGRSWFAERLLSRSSEAVRRVFEEQVMSLAFKWDLEGI